jgi:CRP/FNR family transcriptional regulator, cyclic AMP receptor protein
MAADQHSTLRPAEQRICQEPDRSPNRAHYLLMAQLIAAQHGTLMANRWFAGLPLPLRDDILSRAALRELRAGERLYSRGDAADGWYGVLEGAIKVCATTVDGREMVLTWLEPGTWFGEISLFDDLPRAHDGVAHTATRLLWLTPAQFADLLARHPPFCVALMRLQCQRLRLLFAAVEDLATQPIEARLARQLLGLAASYGRATGDGVAIDLHLPQEEIAQLLGASRQRVNQVLKAWERDGWLRGRYGQLLITDRAALQRCAARAASSEAGAAADP